MKKKIILVISLVLISCKDSTKMESNNKSLHNSSVQKINKLTCEDIIYKIVRSSNLEVRDQEKFLTEIDRIEENNIIIHVYTENDISDNPKKKQIVQSTIAWLLLNTNDSKLFNTTADPDNPIELNFDKQILNKNDIFNLCGLIKKQKYEVTAGLVKYSILPVNFDEYYKVCINPYDSIICNKNYPRYFYNEEDPIVKVFGKNYHPSDYMYLPKINNYQPMILCNTDSDIESYDLIVIDDSKIISSLEIGLMDGESITQFDISKNYIISLYKRKNAKEKPKKVKSYILNQDGKIIESKL
jgi:hypothetical protein